MEKLQAKGELGEEELRALEEDVTGKIMLASWRGTRFEVSQVLREVVDRVLKEHGVPDQVLYNRAKVRRPPRSRYQCYVLTLKHRACFSLARCLSRQCPTRQTRSVGNSSGESSWRVRSVDGPLTSCRMVAEAAAGKSKHHQVRTAQRAKQREAAAAAAAATTSGATITPTTSTVPHVNGDKAPSEKATTPPVSTA